MRVIPTQYEAIDGTIFDDEYDCQKYEYDCLIASSTFKMYDNNLNPTNKIDEAFHVYFPNPKEISTFNKINCEYGYTPITEWDKITTDVIYCYDSDTCGWKQLDEQIQRLQHLKNTIVSKNF